jgi:dsDNA-binding SOS-regulon protein
MDRNHIPTLGPEDFTRAERQRVALRRMEERIVRRVYTRVAIVASLLVVFALLALFLFKTRLESSLFTSISQSVTRQMDRDRQQFLEKLEADRESKLQDALATLDSSLEKRLAPIQEEMDKTKALGEKLAADSDARSRAAEERLQQATKSALEQIERRRTEILEEAQRSADRTEAAYRTASEQAAAALQKARTDLAGLEELSTALRASLPEKLRLLSSLDLDPHAADAEARRSIAALALTALEDAELVQREKLESQAGKVLKRLSEDRRLGDEVFAEVRFHVLRAVVGLRLADIARARSADPASWERKNWILALGALGDVSGMPTLTKIAEERKEPAELRVAAARALGYYHVAAAAPTLPGSAAPEPLPWMQARGQGAGGEFARPWPESGRTPVTSPERQEVRQALSALMGIASSRKESPALRGAALETLGRIGNESAVPELRLVLYEEWDTLGEEIIGTLTGIGGGAAIGLLRDFALAPLGTQELRARAITGLQSIGGRRALAALEKISQEIPDKELKAAARRAAALLEEQAGSGLLPQQSTSDLKLPSTRR